jgi:hypothetical protein
VLYVSISEVRSLFLPCVVCVLCEGHKTGDLLDNTFPVTVRLWFGTSEDSHLKQRRLGV